MSKKNGKTKFSTVKQVVENKTFEAHAIPYQELDEEAEIKKALESDKIEQKEKELLERELEKPFNQRNRALMNKYRGRISETLDGYPPNISNGEYNILAVARDHQDVKLSQRPLPWYAKIEFDANDNHWLFKFPIQREGTGDGAEIYKLDGYETWIYKDGTPIDSMNEDKDISPYIVLWNYIRGEHSLAKEYLDDDKYNFNFPGFYVSYTRESKVEKKQSPRGIQPFTFDTSVERVRGDVSVYNKILANTTSLYAGLGVALSKGLVLVDKISAGSKETLNKWLLFREVKDGKILATIIDGVAAAKEEIGVNKATSDDITKFIVKVNKDIHKQLGKK